MVKTGDQQLLIKVKSALAVSQVEESKCEKEIHDAAKSEENL
jgi:hypothetical protein